MLDIQIKVKQFLEHRQFPFWIKWKFNSVYHSLLQCIYKAEILSRGLYLSPC